MAMGNFVKQVRPKYTGNKKYLVIGGTVRSVNDGQYHYVNPPTLAELYGVNIEECIFVYDRINLIGMDASNLIVLRPDPTGRYTLPTKKGTDRLW